MYPLTIALSIETKELWQEVQTCLQPLPVRTVIEHQDADAMDAFRERLERMRPDVILIDISKWRDPLEDLVRTVRASAPEAMIIALNTSAEADTILAALRAGMNEYLFPPLQGTLRKALEKKSNERGRRREGVRAGGKSMAFFSAKGGCGATTLACHVAVELGRQGQKVLLADLDLDAGMISFLLKTKSPYSILDAVNNLHRMDASYWKALVSNGIPGLEIIPGPSTLASRQQPQPDQLRNVLGFVRTYYDWSVVDLGRSLTHVTLGALEEIDTAVLVSTLEVPALHQAKQIVQTLLDSGFSKSRLRLVLNRVPKRVDITPEELEKMLGLPVFAMLPDDYPELYECYSEGRLLPRTSNLAKHIARVAAKLTGADEEKPGPGGGVGRRLFGLFG